MGVLYRVTAFGKPKGPWRATEKQAEKDAVLAGVGEFDEWGQLYLDAYAEIEWSRIDDLRMSA